MTIVSEIENIDHNMYQRSTHIKVSQMLPLRPLLLSVHLSALGVLFPLWLSRSKQEPYSHGLEILCIQCATDPWEDEVWETVCPEEVCSLS